MACKYVTSSLFLLFIGCLLKGCSPVADEPLPIRDSVRIGLVAHFPMNLAPNDATGNNPDLELINASFKLSGRGNKAGEYALYVEGNSSSYARLYLNNAKAVNGALTISFWAKELGPGVFSPRVFEFWPGNYGPGFYWFNWYQSKVKWAGSDFEVQLDQTFARGVWYHFVLTHSTDGIQIYANGNRIYRANLLNSIPPAAIQLARYAEIGRLAQRPADAFNGGILDFRIYNRILSKNEIDYLYSQ